MSPKITAHSRRSGNVFPLCLGTALRLLGILPSPSTFTRKRAGGDPGLAPVSRLAFYCLSHGYNPNLRTSRASPLQRQRRISLRTPLPCECSVLVTHPERCGEETLVICFQPDHDQAGRREQTDCVDHFALVRAFKIALSELVQVYEETREDHRHENQPETYESGGHFTRSTQRLSLPAQRCSSQRQRLPCRMPCLQPPIVSRLPCGLW